jgi:hypothetical protein
MNKIISVVFFTESMYCWVKISAEMYKTVFSGYLSLISTPIACAKCVLPNPTPPKINNGLNEVPPGLLATALNGLTCLHLLQGNYQNYSSHLVVIQFLNS